MAYRCPQCKKQFAERGPSFPFCCERCKTLDLGAWAAERFRIAGGRLDTTDEAPSAGNGAGQSAGETEKD